MDVCVRTACVLTACVRHGRKRMQHAAICMHLVCAVCMRHMCIPFAYLQHAWMPHVCVATCVCATTCECAACTCTCVGLNVNDFLFTVCTVASLSGFGSLYGYRGNTDMAGGVVLLMAWGCSHTFFSSLIYCINRRGVLEFPGPGGCTLYIPSHLVFGLSHSFETRGLYIENTYIPVYQ
jgi:hypothetical protein